jgi:hypothetical protein
VENRMLAVEETATFVQDIPVDVLTVILHGLTDFVGAPPLPAL